MPTVVPPTELEVCGVGSTPNKGAAREAFRKFILAYHNLFGTTGTTTGALDTLGLTADTGASLIGFKQSGAGAVATTVQEKLRKYPDVVGMGADNTGAIESYSVFSAAIASGKMTLIPAGTYKLNGVNKVYTTDAWLGVLRLGDNNLNNSSDPQVLVGRNVDDTIAGNGHCFSDSSNVNRSGTISYNSFDARITTSGTQSYGHFAPFQNGMVYGSTGTVGYLYGYVDVPTITAGTAAYRLGVRVRDIVKSGSGAVTNNVGIWIDELTAGANGLNYAIRTIGSTPSKFEGAVEFTSGITIPSSPAQNPINSTGTGASLFAGRIQTTNILLTGDTSSDGAIAVGASTGLRLNAKTGSVYDAAMLNVGSSAYVWRVPTGTNDFAIVGKSGFNGTAPIAKPTVTGSRGGNAALASLITALASYGLVVDSTTA